jgi:hypothetical protein
MDGLGKLPWASPSLFYAKRAYGLDEHFGQGCMSMDVK